MSAPARDIEIVCRRCGSSYVCTSYRPTIHLTTEVWTAAEIGEATTATCPECGLEVRLTALVVDGSEFRVIGG